ncbi:MAG TPA: ferredoxin--NADP reductase [Gammaproteobacteria bacterium]|nr:ferredoxin--NADP reductase [Gammaproteobacteria bacterium]
MAKEIDPARWAEGRVVELKPWTDQLFSVRVEADVQTFTAGQFTKLGLPADGDFIERPYSYVNAPDERPLEFYFITVPDGPLTQRLVKLRAGDALYVMRRPSGFLTLSEVPDARHLWLLSTGTGIGPFLSMLKTDEPWRRFERVVLVHAVRHARELSFADTLEKLAQAHGPAFVYVPFVSREPADFALPGRIPQAVEEGTLEQRAGIRISLEDSQVMLCGNPAMVKDMREVLSKRGLAPNRRRSPGHVTVENYW